MNRSVSAEQLANVFPASSLVIVDRAMAELRRGGIVLLRSSAEAPMDGCRHALIMAAENIDETRLAGLAALAGTAPFALVTGRRAMVLGLIGELLPTVMIRAERLDAGLVSSLADPLSEAPSRPIDVVRDVPSWSQAAVTLAKLARLLPAVVAVPVSETAACPFCVDADTVMSYQQIAARSLTRVGEAKVPLVDAENARVIAFRPQDGGIEHFAIVVGTPDPETPVLTRLHSECFTGDVLGSLRCDCGDQLRGAIAEIGRVGSGVLLYLAQEGRGIGLVNKLRAYRLQDAGFDTIDANQQLGFDDDERIYLPAAEMLRLLDIRKVRLMTNNPAKVEGLARHGVTVTERVPLVFPSNVHNVFYLKTKALRSGHLF